MDEIEEYANYFLPELLSAKAVPSFGSLLRKVCDAVGISQPKLEAYAQAEYEQLQKSGFIFPDASPGSLLQEVISRVIRGKQPPSFMQTYIWITVIKRHYSDPRVEAIFDNMDLEVPKFDQDLEDALWALSGYQKPEAVVRAAIKYRNFKSVQRRLPRNADITPQTDANMKIVHRITKDLKDLSDLHIMNEKSEPELQH